MKILHSGSDKVLSNVEWYKVLFGLRVNLWYTDWNRFKIFLFVEILKSIISNYSLQSSNSFPNSYGESGKLFRKLLLFLKAFLKGAFLHLVLIWSINKKTLQIVDLDASSRVNELSREYSTRSLNDKRSS